MSDKLYQEVYKKFNDKQKDTMYDLYMTGINYDGHSMVTYGDVEKSVAIVIKEAYQQVCTDAIEDAIHSLDNSKAICHEDYVDGIDFAIGVLRNIAEQMQRGGKKMSEISDVVNNYEREKAYYYGCKEDIEKAYQQGKLDGAREFAEWLCRESNYTDIDINGFITCGCGFSPRDTTIEQALSEWQKERT